MSSSRNHPTWFHKATAVGRAIDPRLSACAPTREERNAWSRLLEIGPLHRDVPIGKAVVGKAKPLKQHR